MKRILATLLVILVLMLAVSGCGKEAPPEPEPAPAPEPEPVPEPEPEPEPEVEEPVPMEVEEGVEGSELKEEVAVEGECVDTDGGENYAVFGEVFDANGAHSEDVCSKNEVYANRLYEYVCAEDGSKDRITYECENGCEEGACV